MYVVYSFDFNSMTTTSFFFFFSSRRRHTRFSRDWSSDVCSSDLVRLVTTKRGLFLGARPGCRTTSALMMTRYAAKTWARRRRVIIKAEVVRHPGRAPKNNPRFVVTNLTAPPAWVYALYCQRGDVENRLKELHHGLEMDRTSCSRFRANQFRVLLTLAAYILFQELRRRTAMTAEAQVTTLRERFLKLAVWVERSARRIVLHLPQTFPWLSTWRQLARAVGATS